MLELADAQLIVVEAADTASLATLCRRIDEESRSSHPPMLAVAATGDVETRVQVLEAGADDVLALPIDERELAATVDALLLRSAPPRTAPLMPSPSTAQLRVTPGRVIVFASAKGGSGTTTLAVNTALVLAEMAP